MHLINCPFSS
uniref:Uncharacterized protein n=1 Tax=Rhizophora mucronata TaxID=61149 RepID=A0A2P2NXM6_RHIMU